MFQGYQRTKGFRVSRDRGFPLADRGFQRVWRLQSPKVSRKMLLFWGESKFSISTSTCENCIVSVKQEMVYVWFQESCARGLCFAKEVVLTCLRVSLPRRLCKGLYLSRKNVQGFVFVKEVGAKVYTFFKEVVQGFIFVKEVVQGFICFSRKLCKGLCLSRKLYRVFVC